MSDDGGWCWAGVHFVVSVGGRGGGFLAVPQMQVTGKPEHGDVLTGGLTDNSTRIAYRPASGFVGTDSFVVRLIGPSRSTDMTFAVTVTP